MVRLVTLNNFLSKELNSARRLTEVATSADDELSDTRQVVRIRWCQIADVVMDPAGCR